MSQQTVKRARARRWIDDQSRVWYRLVRFLLRVIFRFWVRRFRTFGAENVPREGAAFLLANHTSGIDPLLMGLAVPHRMLVGPGKVQIFTNPVFSYVMRKIGIFPLHQGTADPAAVRTMVEAYRKGRVVVVYPEGGRSRTGDMLPFVEEFTRLVLRLKAPIIPAGIAGATELLPLNGWIPRPNTPCTVVIGSNIDLAQFHHRRPDSDTIAQATAILWHCVHDMVLEAEKRRSEMAAS